ncbi:MAG: hypothetical protein H6Q69_2616 [Firmicutes bacterium]|nr:hypothetical protein [Bacillota bacterium]
MLLLGRCGKRKGIFPPRLLIKALAAINDTETVPLVTAKDKENSCQSVWI